MYVNRGHITVNIYSRNVWIQVFRCLTLSNRLDYFRSWNCIIISTDVFTWRLFDKIMDYLDACKRGNWAQNELQMKILNHVRLHFLRKLPDVFIYLCIYMPLLAFGTYSLQKRFSWSVFLSCFPALNTLKSRCIYWRSERLTDIKSCLLRNWSKLSELMLKIRKIFASGVRKIQLFSL